MEAVKSTALSTAGLGCFVDAMEVRRSGACDTLALNTATQGELMSTSSRHEQVSVLAREIGAQPTKDSTGSPRCLRLETLNGGGSVNPGPGRPVSSIVAVIDADCHEVSDISAHKSCMLIDRTPTAAVTILEPGHSRDIHTRELRGHV